MMTGTVCDMRPEVAEHIWSIWSWTTELLVFLVVPLAILALNIRVIAATQRVAENMQKLLDDRAERRALHLHNDTHKHPFNGPLSGTTRVSRYLKGKTNLDFTEARDSE